MDVAAFLEENWLSVAVAGYLIGMMLYGHYRGFLRLVVSMTALLIAVVGVRLAMPYVSGFVKENTGIHQWMEETMIRAIGLEEWDGTEEDSVLPAGQRELIEGIALPQSVKDALIENNNGEIYELLNADQFIDYIGSFLADRILNTLTFLVLFVVIYVAIRVLAHILDVVARLPVLSGMNQIAGAVLGLAMALCYFWIFCLVLNLFVGTDWGRYLLNAIESCGWVSFLYRNNFLSGVLLSVIWNLV